MLDVLATRVVRFMMPTSFPFTSIVSSGNSFSTFHKQKHNHNDGDGGGDDDDDKTLRTRGSKSSGTASQPLLSYRPRSNTKGD